jgi:hypothetical protein
MDRVVGPSTYALGRMIDTTDLPNRKSQQWLSTVSFIFIPLVLQKHNCILNMENVSEKVIKKLN